MANNYCVFSEVIGGITDEEKKWVSKFLTSPEDWECEGPGLNPDDDDFEEKQLADWMEFHGFDQSNIDRLEYELDYWPNFQWSFEPETAHTKTTDNGRHIYEKTGKNELWLRSEEGFDVDNLILFVTKFHKKFRPEGVFQATWADYCSKPRIGEFGGGAVVVYGEKVDWNTTYGAGVEMLEHLREPWKNDKLQFARLLDEIRATQDLSAWTDLCASMDLDPEQVDELFERAHRVWEDAKEKLT